MNNIKLSDKTHQIGTTAVLIAAVVFSVFGAIPLLNALLIPIFMTGLYFIAVNEFQNCAVRLLLWATTVVVGFFIAIYRPGNFSYPLIWDSPSLYPEGDFFALFVNTSKALGGYLVIIWLLGSIASKHQRNIGASIAFSILGIGAIILTAIMVGLEFQFKLPHETIWFILFNLGVTVVSEEAFFRLLLQHRIASSFQNKGLGNVLAVGITTLLFAAAHTQQIDKAFLITLFAGFIYATVFALTNRVSIAITTHFGVNLIHFIFLEYPIPVDF